MGVISLAAIHVPSWLTGSSLDVEIVIERGFLGLPNQAVCNHLHLEKSRSYSLVVRTPDFDVESFRNLRFDPGYDLLYTCSQPFCNFFLRNSHFSFLFSFCPAFGASAEVQLLAEPNGHEVEGFKEGERCSGRRGCTPSVVQYMAYVSRLSSCPRDWSASATACYQALLLSPFGIEATRDPEGFTW